MNEINSQIHLFYAILWYTVFAVMAFKSIVLAKTNERASNIYFVIAHIFGVFAMLFTA